MNLFLVSLIYYYYSQFDVINGIRTTLERASIFLLNVGFDASPLNQDFVYRVKRIFITRPESSDVEVYIYKYFVRQRTEST